VGIGLVDDGLVGLRSDEMGFLWVKGMYKFDRNNIKV
jgi:hypothetical protein